MIINNVVGQLRRCRIFTAVLVVVLAGLMGSQEVVAHATGETYVWLNVEESSVAGRVEINLNDLEKKFSIQFPEEHEKRLALLELHRSTVLSYIAEHFKLETEDRPIEITFNEITILDLGPHEGSYAQYIYSTPEGTIPQIVKITNSLFLEASRFHRSLVCIERNRQTGQVFAGEFTALIFGPHNPVQELDLTNIELLLQPRDFIWQGVLHIWIGIDHILFLLSLLLPAVLVLNESKWLPVEDFKQSFWNVIKIVTIFTVAHSISLSLAVLGFIQLPSRFVESVIALSIILVVVNTLIPKIHLNTWLVIFGFGLFHGLGFASVMGELPFRLVNLLKVMIGFNVGVELGQLAIVAAVFPVIFLLRKKKIYVPVVLRGGSLLMGCIALFWFIERAFAL